MDYSAIANVAQEAAVEAIKTCPQNVSHEDFSRVISAAIISALQEYDRQRNS